MAKTEKNTRKKDLIFEEVALKWLKEKKGNIKDSSIVQYEHLLDAILLPKLGKKKMKSVCKREFLKILENELIEEGYSENSVSNILVIVKCVVNFNKGTLKNIGNSPKRECIKVITKEHIKKILALAKRDKEHNEYKKLGILIILYSGLTISELCALKWENINLETKSICISSTLRREKGLDSDKSKLESNESKKRIIPINKQLEKCFCMLTENHSENFYVLTNTSKPMEPRTFQYFLNSIFKNLPGDYTASNLRDTFIITALKNGMNPVFLAEITGISLNHLFYRYQKFMLEINDEQKIKEIQKIKY